MDLQGFHQKLASGFLPSTEQSGRWENFKPNEDQAISVVKCLGTALRKILQGPEAYSSDFSRRFYLLQDVTKDIVHTKLPGISTLIEEINDCRKQELASILSSLPELLDHNSDKQTLKKKVQFLFKNEGELNKEQWGVFLGRLNKWMSEDTSLCHELAYTGDEINEVLLRSNPKAQLYHAIRRQKGRSAEEIQRLLKQYPEWINDPLDKTGSTFLHRASFEDSATCENLLAHGASVDAVDDHLRLPMDAQYRPRDTQEPAFETYLHLLIPESLGLASASPRLQRVFKDLCLHPTDSEYAKSPRTLELALDFVSAQGFEWAKEHPNLVTIWLCHAILCGVSSEKLSDYLSKIPVAFDEYRGANLLRLAITQQRADVVKCLLELGVPAETSYHRPFFWTQKEEEDRLSNASRNPLREVIGSTPLKQAVALNNLEIAHLLLEKMINPTFVDSKNSPPSFVHKWVQLFIAKGNDVEKLTEELAELIKGSDSGSLSFLEDLCPLVTRLNLPLLETVIKVKERHEHTLIKEIAGLNKKSPTYADKERLSACANALAKSRLSPFSSVEQKKKIEHALTWVGQKATNDAFCDEILRHSSIPLALYLNERNPLRTAYHAVMQKDVVLLEKILHHARGISKKADSPILSHRFANGDTLLHMAVKDDYDSRIPEMLLSFGASIDAVNDRQLPPLNNRPMCRSGFHPTKLFLEQLMPESLAEQPGAVQEAFRTLCLWRVEEVPPDVATLERVIAFLSDPTQAEWRSAHSNLIALWLILAMRQMPSLKLAALLPHFQEIIADKQGECLLFEAVRLNRGELVTRLLSLGVDGQAPYAKPPIASKDRENNYVRSPPLYHALMSKNLDAVRALVNHERIDPKDVFAIAAKVALKDDSEADAFWRFLLEIFPENTALVANQKEARFALAVKQNNWVEIAYWMDQGLVPADPASLAQSALKTGQEWFVERLEGQGLLNGVPGRLLSQIVSYRDQSWARFFLKQLHTKNVDICKNSLLQEAALAGHLETAAWLVSLGVPLDAHLPNAKHIRHIVSCFKGSDAERDFRLELTDRNLAHLVGDSFCKKMKGDDGHSLEGNQHSASLSFLTSALTYASEKEGDSLKGVIRCFEKARSYAKQMEALFFIASPQRVKETGPRYLFEKLALGIGNLERQIIDDLNHLSPGEALLIPGGWVTGEKFAHAIAFACNRLPSGEIELQVINTGEGAQFHGMAHDRARLHIDTINRYRLSPERFAESHVLRSLIEINTAGGAFLGTQRRYHPEDVYSLLAPFQVGEEVIIADTGRRKAQLAGTCSMRCYMAYLKSQLPLNAYKALRDLMNEDAVTFAIEQYEPLLQERPNLSKFLALAVPHLFDTFGKRLKARDQIVPQDHQRLDKLEASSNRLKEATSSNSSPNPAFTLLSNYPTRSAQIKQKLAAIAKKRVVSGVIFGATKSSATSASFQPLSLQSIRSVQDLVNSVTDLRLFSKQDGNSTPYLTASICQLGRAFMTHGPDGFSAVLAELRDKPDACEVLIHELTQLSMELRASSRQQGKQLDPSRFLAINYALVMSHQLVTMIEAKRDYPPEACVSHYGISLFQNLLKSDFQKDVLLNANWEEDFAILLNANKWYKATAAGETPLFNFNSQKLTSNAKNDLGNTQTVLRVTPENGEYHYAKAFIPFHADWNRADRTLRSLLVSVRKKMKEEPVVDQAEWRANWLFTKKLLPSYFYNLRSLAVMAHAERPGATLPSSDYITQFDPTEPYLEPSQSLSPSERSMLPCYHDPMVMRYSDSESLSSLPEGLSKERNAFSSDLKLETRSQNGAICEAKAFDARELMSIRYGANETSPFGNVSLPLLLDSFDKKLDLFVDAGHRFFFEYTLFSVRHLSQGCQSHPHLVGEIETFFNRALAHFEDRIDTEGGIASSVKAHLFLLNQQTRFLAHCQRANIELIGTKLTADLMQQARRTIQSLLKDPKYQSEESQHYLHLILLDSYQSAPIGTKDEVQNILLSVAAQNFHHLTGGGESSFAPAFIASAQSVPFEQAESIRSLLEKYPIRAQRVLRGMADYYGIEVPRKVEWKSKGFPLFICQLEGRNEVVVNVLNGDLTKNGQRVAGTSDWMKKSEIYRRLFSDQKLTFTHRKAKLGGVMGLGGKPIDVHESGDQHGAIQVLATDNTRIDEVRRQIGGRWYSYVDQKKVDEHPPIPPIKDASKWKIWRSVDEGSSYLMVDPTTIQPKMKLDRNGHYSFAEDNFSLSYEWVDLNMMPQASAILALDRDAVLLQQVSENSPLQMRLQLPNLSLGGEEALEFVRQKPVGSDQERWVVRKMPHLFLSEEQKLPELRGYQDFLIVQTTAGEREAILPLKSYQQIQSKAAVTTSCIRVRVSKETKAQPAALVSQSPDRSAYLAYLALTHAKKPEDYQRTMQHLQRARKFDRYTDTELRTLGQLMLSHHETQDHTGYAYACRLYVSWMVHDNLKRNPLRRNEISDAKPNPSWPAFESPPSDWRSFWEGSYVRKVGEQVKTANTIIATVAKGYFERSQHLPLDMRIENILTNRELMDWDIQKKMKSPNTTSKFPNPPDVGTMRQPNNLPWSDAQRVGSELITRPGEILRGHFEQLLGAALSGDEGKQRSVEDIARSMTHDRDLVLGRLILEAALEYESNPQAIRLVDSARLMLVSDLNDESDRDRLWLAAKNYANAKSNDKAVGVGAPVQPVELLPPQRPIVMPNAPPAPERIPFTPPPETIARFDRLLEKAFNISRSEEEVQIEPFVLDTDDPWLRASVHDLNEDYLAGAQKNSRAPVYTLTGKVSVDQLCSTHLEAISKHVDFAESGNLKRLEVQFLEMANRLPTDPLEALRYQAAISSGRQQAVSTRDCIGLFLSGNREVYRRATNLTFDEDIDRLHQLIGEYILAHNRIDRYKSVAKSLHNLDALRRGAHTSEQMEQALQAIAEELSVLKQPSDSHSPRLEDLDLAPTLMVFEYALGLTLRGDQIEGIQDMMDADVSADYRMRSKLLQRIQGGGKSLVFGHIMALLKADGYHLSVHVPPTSAYQTALYDMEQRSRDIYGQREHTFVFDDDPLKFTTDYLTSIKQTMVEAIVNRDYVTVTNETLRAMRCKYIKTQFLLQKLPEGENKNALRASNALLGEILSLMRDRAIFTFDEVHLALDPTKELNMPYGQITRLKPAECALISKVLQIACLAKDGDKRPLLDIKHSSQQTATQRKQMIQAVIDGLLEDPSWNIPGMRAFLSGETSDIPAALDDPDQRDFAKRVTLGKMLCENWLVGRLEKNVDESHGLAENTFPRISIPFVASMKPAYGSEFSDSSVITTNTFIAYLANGLNEEQTIDFIKLAKQKAFAEKEAKKESDPDLSIQDTLSASAFKNSIGKPLFRVDPSKHEDVTLVQKELLNGTQGSMELLLDYVIERELSQVEIFEHQVCSNGQNTASMAQSIIGYSASMENANMSPIGTELKPEKGTNGQTIDRLISQKTEIHLVDNSPEALFDHLISSHARREDVRAIIDVGAHFRGIENENVAQLICAKLQEYDSEAVGTLFFHSKTSKLCFMHRDSVGDYTVLSGTTPEIIRQETGLSPHQLFTFYDQDHITGTDLLQMPQAVAVLTMKETTVEHEVLQGARRMRGLDRGQRIMIALSKGSVEPITHLLGIEGQDAQPTLTIQQVLLYTRVQEAMKQKPLNLLFALQKIENQIQQFVLDRLYPQTDEGERERLFAHAGYLFDKNIAVDLYNEYAHQRQNIPIDVYLLSAMDGLLSPLSKVFLVEELVSLRKLIKAEVINETTLKGIQKEISLSHAFSPSQPADLLNPNREATRMQYSEQAKDTVKDQVTEQEQENLDEYLRQVDRFRDARGKRIKEFGFDKGEFLSPTFGQAQPEVDLESRRVQYENAAATELRLVPKIWELNKALAFELEELPEGLLFDERLNITNNAGVVLEGRTDLLGPIRKRPFPLLVIYDDTTNQWKTILCSVKDSLQFEAWLLDRNNVLPEGRKMWLLRTNGKLCCSREHYDKEMLKNPKLQPLIFQALLFAGDFQTLSRKPWSRVMKEWVSEMKTIHRQAWADFFETQILMGMPPGYSSSTVYKLFHAVR